VTPRVMRVGSPENIHVQAHSDSTQPLETPLGVNVTVWDFPLRMTMVARTQLLLSPKNDFMTQMLVTVGDRPGWVKGRPHVSREGLTLGALLVRDTGELTQCLYVIILLCPLEIRSPLGQKELPLAGQTSLCELYGRPLLVIEEVERGLGFRGSVPLCSEQPEQLHMASLLPRTDPEGSLPLSCFFQDLPQGFSPRPQQNLRNVGMSPPGS
jgi:hypothetical protein